MNRMFPIAEPIVKADVAQVVASYCVTQLTIFSEIQLWSQYYANQESIIGVMNKEG